MPRGSGSPQLCANLVRGQDSADVLLESEVGLFCGTGGVRIESFKKILYLLFRSLIAQHTGFR